MPTTFAALQYRAPKGQPCQAREALAHHLRTAGRAGAQLAVAPEMATTGYVWPSASLLLPYAEAADGPTAAKLGPIAREFEMWVVCGFAETEGDQLYNSALVLDHTGNIAGVYRKIDLFELDTLWATPGRDPLMLTAPFGTVGVGICRDLVEDRFPQWLRQNQPDALAFCAAWVPGGEDVHAYWQERLAGYRGVTVAADGWGTDWGVPCAGLSAILTAQGVSANAPASGDAVIIASPDR